MTEVTEVTSEQPAAAAEGETKPEEGKKEEEPKEEEPKEKPKEEKKEPEPKVEKPPPDYRTVKAGWVEKPGKDVDLSISLSLSLIHPWTVCAGVIFKSFKRLYMTLDEEGSVLRWWKTEQRTGLTGLDASLYMK